MQTSLVRRRSALRRPVALLAAMALLVTSAPGPVRAAETPLPSPIWGYADLHTHMFSYEGFGGNWFHGRPASLVDGKLVDSPASALSNCAGVHGHGHAIDLVGIFNDQGTVHNVGHPEYDGWPYWNSLDHQVMYWKWLKRAHDGGLRLMVMHALNNEVLCESALAGAKGGYDCKDMPAVDRQIQAAKDFEKAIDDYNGGEGKGWFRIVTTPQAARDAIEDGQLAVVLGIEVDNLFNCTKKEGCTAEQVRTRVKEYYDKGVRHVFPLAHFDNAFGGAAIYNSTFNVGNNFVTGDFFTTAPASECRDRGIRYSLANEKNFCEDVAGGGTGVGASGLCLGSKISVGPACLLIGTPPPLSWIAALTCLAGAITAGACNHVLDNVCADFPPTYAGESCNAVGLTAIGRTAIRELMANHMIIDVDHMSARATDAMLDLAEQESYPVVSGHTGFTAISHEQKASEGNKTPAVVERLRRLGALVAPILSQGTARGDGSSVGEISHWGQINKPYPPCSRSGWGWAQAYKYAVEAMGGAPVAFGSDFNGIVQPPAPRYATSEEDANYTALGKECFFKGHEDIGRGQSAAQPAAQRLKYPFTLPGIVDASGKPREFPRANICDGSETKCKRGVNMTGELDFNVEGLAHVGLLPDFIADLQANGQGLGFTDAELAPLFRSAEAYIQLWERVDAHVPRPDWCTGKRFGDLCLYPSFQLDVEKGCHETCEAQGLHYDLRTADLGSRGDVETCRAAWRAFGVPEVFLTGNLRIDVPRCPAGVGCYYDRNANNFAGGYGHCQAPATTSTAKLPDGDRLCACTNATESARPTACDGDNLGTDCLFVSNSHESCVDRCAAAGRIYDQRTESVIGSGGTDAGCQAAWEVLAGFSVPLYTESTCRAGIGCHAFHGIDPATGIGPAVVFVRCAAPSTTATATDPDPMLTAPQRLCVCSKAPPAGGIRNGLAEGIEECDGGDLRGMSCPTGFPGTLACTANGTFDTSQCGFDLEAFCPVEALVEAGDGCTGGEPGAGAGGCTIDPPGPFPLGTTDVTIACTNPAGSCATKVVVTDRTAPAITCRETVECDGAGGATASLAASATDNCTASPQTSCVGATGAMLPLGAETPVVCSAADGNGNASTCESVVTVVDTQPPAITCPDGFLPAAQCGAERKFVLTTTDVCDPTPAVACVDQHGGAVDPAGHTLPLGTTTVTCTLTDRSGNTASCSFTETVDSMLCPVEELTAKVDGLIAKIETSALPNPLRQNLLRILMEVREKIELAEALLDAGRIGAARGKLRAAERRLRSVAWRVRSLNGRRAIPDELRAILNADALGIRDEVKALRRSL